MKLFKHSLVARIIAQLDKLARIVNKAVADKLGEHSRKARICLAEPAAVSYAVCNICEFIRLKSVEIAENGILEDLAVKRGNAVDLMADGNAKVSHSDCSV